MSISKPLVNSDCYLYIITPDNSASYVPEVSSLSLNSVNGLTYSISMEVRLSGSNGLNLMFFANRVHGNILHILSGCGRRDVYDRNVVIAVCDHCLFDSVSVDTLIAGRASDSARVDATYDFLCNVVPVYR